MRERLKNGLCLVGALLLYPLLVSCGDGRGNADAGPNEKPVALESVRLTCHVIDRVSRRPVADAGINYQSRTVEFATQTDADGYCEPVMPAADVAGVPYPAASVSKAGYEPQTMLFEKLQGGKGYHQDVELEPLAANVSIPVGGEKVMHLGDDLFEGTVNSQFQKKTDGAELRFVISDWAAKVAAGYTKATVYLDAKGWQSNICTNLVGLSGDVGTVTLPGGTSPTDGYWAGGKQVPFEFSMAQVGTQLAEVAVISGSCNETTDIDDFEINRIRVYFN